MMLAHSQVRFLSSCQPSASARTKLVSSVCGGTSGIGRRRRKSALRTKLAESTAKTTPVPTVAMRMPASVGAPRPTMPRVRPISAFACCRRAGLTVSGTTAVDAGVKKAAAVPQTALETTRCQTSAWPLNSRTAIVPCETARTASADSITRPRGHRSPATPPASTSTMFGTSPTASTRPRSVPEPWMPSTAKANPTGTILSPTAEAVRASQRRRNERSESAPSLPRDRTNRIFTRLNTP